MASAACLALICAKLTNNVVRLIRVLTAEAGYAPFNKVPSQARDHALVDFGRPHLDRWLVGDLTTSLGFRASAVPALGAFAKKVDQLVT